MPVVFNLGFAKDSLWIVKNNELVVFHNKVYYIVLQIKLTIVSVFRCTIVRHVEELLLKIFMFHC